MDICIDFDGTCTTHEFPGVGKEIGAVPVLKKLVENKHRLILFTMRSNMVSPLSLSDPTITKDEHGDFLNDAIKWFNKHGIPLYGIQSNPTQTQWTQSPKAYGQLYIDDAALGCPLLKDSSMSDRPYVNWKEVEKMLVKRGIIA